MFSVDHCHWLIMLQGLLFKVAALGCSLDCELDELDALVDSLRSLFICISTSLLRSIRSTVQFGLHFDPHGFRGDWSVEKKQNLILLKC